MGLWGVFFWFGGGFGVEWYIICIVEFRSFKRETTKQFAIWAVCGRCISGLAYLYLCCVTVQVRYFLFV